MDLKERIKEIRKSSGLSQRDFGKRISVSDSAISKIEAGENTPSDQTLRLICQEFRVNYSWLKDGTGEMLLPEDEDEAVNRLMLGGTEFQKRVFRAMASMPDAAWDALQSFVDQLKKDGQS